MTDFETPTDLMNNRGLIADPEAFAREKGAASWLFLCGEEFASRRAACRTQTSSAPCPWRRMSSRTRRFSSTSTSPASRSRRSTACPGRPLVTCRTGPRSSALIYLYAGLQAGASAEDVFARAEADDAAFVKSDELRAWVADGLEQLS